MSRPEVRKAIREDAGPGWSIVAYEAQDGPGRRALSKDEKRALVKQAWESQGVISYPTAEPLPPPIQGMEGPFRYRSGKVFYYDPAQGAHYDQEADLYVSAEEVLAHSQPRGRGARKTPPTGWTWGRRAIEEDEVVFLTRIGRAPGKWLVAKRYDWDSRLRYVQYWMGRGQWRGQWSKYASDPIKTKHWWSSGYEAEEAAQAAGMRPVGIRNKGRKFNKRVSKCISGKVRGEGWEQRQAVAACLNMDRAERLRADGSYRSAKGRRAMPLDVKARAAKHRLDSEWHVEVETPRGITNVTGAIFVTKKKAEDEARIIRSQLKAGVPVEALGRSYWERYHQSGERGRRAGRSSISEVDTLIRRAQEADLSPASAGVLANIIGRMRDDPQSDYYRPPPGVPGRHIPSRPLGFDDLSMVKMKLRRLIESGGQGRRATTYFKGDKARYTGKSEVLHGGRFYEVVLVEGHRKGEKKWVHNAPGANITSRGRRAGKKPTYAKARKDILAYLGTEGWDLSSPSLKVPHATSPGGSTRLYFKAQSVHLDDGGKPFSLGASRSMWLDIRELTPHQFLGLLNRRMQRGSW